jgi:hypothetical protein
VEVIKSTMPVVGNLKDESKTMQHRHWAEVYETIGIELTLDDDSFTLQSLIDLDVKKEKDTIADIALKAQKEKELE